MTRETISSRILRTTPLRHFVMSRDTLDRCRETFWTLAGLLSRSERLVDPLGIQSETSNQGPVGGHDADVAVSHQDQYGLFVVSPADGHVVERASVTQRDVAAVDLVLANSTVRRHREGLA